MSTHRETDVKTLIPINFIKHKIAVIYPNLAHATKFVSKITLKKQKNSTL